MIDQGRVAAIIGNLKNLLSLFLLIITGRDLLTLAIRVLEGDVPLLTVALLLLFDCRFTLPIVASLLVLLSPALKSYFKQVSHFQGSRLERLWEMNTLSGQLMTGLSALTALFSFELNAGKAILQRETRLKERLCLSVAAFMALGLMQKLMFSSVIWYILLKHSAPVQDFKGILERLFKFLHFYTGNSAASNNLFSVSASASSISLSIEVWENERKWWPAGWTSTLLRSDSRGSFTDESGLHTFSPTLIRLLKEAELVSVESGSCGEWLYCDGKWQPTPPEVAEVRKRRWRWEKRDVNIVHNWQLLQNLLQISQ